MRTLAWLGVLPALGAAAVCAAADLPDGIERRGVLSDAVIDGRAATVTVLHSALGPQEALERCQRAWSAEGGQPPRSARIGEWVVLWRRVGTVDEVLQWRATPDGGAMGYLSRSRPAGQARLAVPGPLPGGFVAVRSLWQRADGRAVLTRTARGDMPTDAAQAVWRDTLRRQGWIPERRDRQGEWFRRPGGQALVRHASVPGGTLSTLIEETAP